MNRIIPRVFILLATGWLVSRGAYRLVAAFDPLVILSIVCAIALGFIAFSATIESQRNPPHDDER